ncbi:MAG: gamma-glutamylcyclotransferase [Rhodobacteraceae bacterium]|jgi:cation transport protein ChaC|nr:gamma-glutamylcyclotransferase [Paracoccaceae bacterium]
MREDFWVFGYASLLWNPGFPVAERRRARLEGWHRTFCMWSIHHRGTPERPGLVLALDEAEGAVCHGVALRVAQGAEDETLAYLRERELVSSAYLERRLPVIFDDGGARAEALAYVVDRSHGQYCGGLALERQAQVIAAATGGRGPNPDYLFNTADHLRELGVEDHDLAWLVRRVRALTGQAPGG